MKLVPSAAGSLSMAFGKIHRLLLRFHQLFIHTPFISHTWAAAKARSAEH